MKKKPIAWGRHLKRARAIKERNNSDADDLYAVGVTLLVAYGLIKLDEEGLIHAEFSISPDGREAAMFLDQLGMGRREGELPNTVTVQVLNYLLEGVVPLTPAGMDVVQKFDPTITFNGIRDVLLWIMQASLPCQDEVAPQ